MCMITQNINEAQETLAAVFQDNPIVLVDGWKSLFFLIKDLHPELEKYILTGEAAKTKYQVISSGDAQALAHLCSRLDLTLTYHSQQMEYMNNIVTIIYPRVRNAATGMKISLIPWFARPGRPYPIFTYMYAVWHYQNSEEKSQRLTAAATAKLFGINSFNKSTVCRSNRDMGRFFETIQLDRPLTAIACKEPSTKEMIDFIPRLLKDCPNIETLKEMCGESASRILESNNVKRSVLYGLSGIPQECSKVIKEKEAKKSGSRDGKKRAGRPRAKGVRPMKQRKAPDFVEAPQLKHIRETFIASCRGAVMVAAVTYHQLIL